MNENLTHIVVVQDKSGSMGSLAQDVIGGFNAFIREQREAPGEAEVTLVQFSGEVQFVYEGTPIDEVPALTPATYRPGGSTALYEAIGQAIVRTDARVAALPEAARPGRVIMVIMTDGHNTDTSEFTRPRVGAMIEQRQRTGRFEFIYIGVAWDAMAAESHVGAAAALGLRAANVGAVSANANGLESSYHAASEAVMRYRSGGTSELNPQMISVAERVPENGAVATWIGNPEAKK